MGCCWSGSALQCNRQMELILSLFAAGGAFRAARRRSGSKQIPLGLLPTGNRRGRFIPVLVMRVARRQASNRPVALPGNSSAPSIRRVRRPRRLPMNLSLPPAPANEFAATKGSKSPYGDSRLPARVRPGPGGVGSPRRWAWRPWWPRLQPPGYGSLAQHTRAARVGFSGRTDNCFRINTTSVHPE
jgi:hypothetical protein